MSYGQDSDSLESEDMRKIFIGGIHKECPESEMETYFSQYGEIVDKCIICDGQKISKGFGFVTFANAISVDDALRATPHNLFGKQVEIKRAIPKDMNDSHHRVKKIFIGGLPKDTSEDDIRSYIDSRHSGCVKIEKVIIPQNDSGENKGFAFVECENEDQADRLCISERNCSINGKVCGMKKVKDQSGPGQGRGSGREQRGGRGGGMVSFGGRGSYGGGDSYRGGHYGGNSYGGDSYRGQHGDSYKGGFSGGQRGGYDAYDGGYQQRGQERQSYGFSNNYGGGNYRGRGRR